MTDEDIRALAEKLDAYANEWNEPETSGLPAREAATALRDLSEMYAREARKAMVEAERRSDAEARLAKAESESRTHEAAWKSAEAALIKAEGETHDALARLAKAEANALVLSGWVTTWKDQATADEARLAKATEALRGLLHHDIAHVGPSAGQRVIEARATLAEIEASHD